ncbi:Transcriptional regulator, GntR family [Pediococcus damnosus]|uniref:Transcriptional regulator, GntR family n=1 Tax=Pediococcus damnosus TaxID=51663 RepID=A0A0R2HKE2_9LACO|nr:GntR family transcriptional regulator [Pediococcus damnosus]AMV60739.1 Transcriptional regulator, GntR family [Pediococcus damnosus]AMV63331.1 Transcriptional regulator, GntR family [Pediococcus damnosus]AMV65051.1 Transcriptional regulator, GntR family [Pediococcus damnosus]AMV66768.1 Transcriptional regulator, GntR family [Pediococcus damnosus]AMV69867.1 Transcriptional regulator, GntR family [Pediococcus damnosus]
MYKYQEISEKIREEIVNGNFKAGGLLPDQNQLAEAYDTTRITIRKAIQSLIIEGIVYTKRGAGTFVRKDYLQNLDEGNSIDKPLGTTRTHPNKKVTSKVLNLDARLPNQEEQANLMITATEPVYVIDRVRYINKKVYSYEHTIMPTAVAQITREILEGSIYSYLMDKCHLTISGSHRIVKADKATQQDTKALGIGEGEPVLVIQQVSYLEDGEPFEFSKSRFPYQTSQVTADVNLKN